MTSPINSNKSNSAEYFQSVNQQSSLHSNKTTITASEVFNTISSSEHKKLMPLNKVKESLQTSSTDSLPSIPIPEELTTPPSDETSPLTSRSVYNLPLDNAKEKPSPTLPRNSSKELPPNLPAQLKPLKRITDVIKGATTPVNSAEELPDLLTTTPKANQPSDLSNHNIGPFSSSEGLSEGGALSDHLSDSAPGPNSQIMNEISTKQDEILSLSFFQTPLNIDPLHPSPAQLQRKLAQEYANTSFKALKLFTQLIDSEADEKTLTQQKNDLVVYIDRQNQLGRQCLATVIPHFQIPFRENGSFKKESSQEKQINLFSLSDSGGSVDFDNSINDLFNREFFLKFTSTFNLFEHSNNKTILEKVVPGLIQIKSNLTLEEKIQCLNLYKDSLLILVEILQKLANQGYEERKIILSKKTKFYQFILPEIVQSKLPAIVKTFQNLLQIDTLDPKELSQTLSKESVQSQFDLSNFLALQDEKEMQKIKEIIKSTIEKELDSQENPQQIMIKKNLQNFDDFLKSLVNLLPKEIVEKKQPLKDIGKSFQPLLKTINDTIRRESQPFTKEQKQSKESFANKLYSNITTGLKNYYIDVLLNSAISKLAKNGNKKLK